MSRFPDSGYTPRWYGTELNTIVDQADLTVKMSLKILTCEKGSGDGACYEVLEKGKKVPACNILTARP